MSFEFLKPINESLLVKIIESTEVNLGKKVLMHTSKKFPDLTNVKIAIIGVLDNRGNKNFEQQSNLDEFRSMFYQLYPGNWDSVIADLGDLKAGSTQKDTYYALTDIIYNLSKNKIITIVLGGSQDLTYPIYRAYDHLEQMVNLTLIDSKFDIGKENEIDNDESYVSKMIINPPHNLFNYANIGYQVFYNSQEEIDLIDKMYFDIYRLGDVLTDITLAEPVLRDSDIVSLDFNSIKSSVTGNFKNFQPNGFDGVEICKLSRYAGISDRVGVFGVFNMQNHSNENVILSQIVWYFIEGYNLRSNEYPFASKSDYTKYHVLVEDIDLKFYKSNKTGRWWMSTPNNNASSNILNNNSLLSCSEDDYLKACDQEIPERWWRSVKKQIL